MRAVQSLHCDNGSQNAEHQQIKTSKNKENKMKKLNRKIEK